VIGKEVSHYRILEKIGGGGMGVVYKAEDTRLGRAVALKFLNPGLLANESVRKRFLHEARAASLIDHPNVCHVYEVADAPDGRLFMAMSYCEGRSLREVIDAGSVAPREAFGIAFGIAQGLWAAHRRSIVHRDVKPGNVILTDDGFVRIVDFGLALLLGHSRVTTSGVTVGTVAYMSPEQAGGGEVDARTDIWSLGVTLYELMTGRLPFRGEINPAMVYSIVHEPHTPVTELNASVPVACARVIDRCLEKDPEKRYRTIEDLLEDMVRVARELGWDASVASATIAPILRARRWQAWRRRVLIAGAAALVVAGGAWGAYKWTQRSPALFTTEMRVAVMPFKNHIGPTHEAFVSGLGDHVARLFDAARLRHESLWSVPYSTVVRAQLPGPAAAGAAFGVNRVVTGDVQRYAEACILTLELHDATTLEVVSHEVIEFQPGASAALLDDVSAAVHRMAEIEDGELPPVFHAARADAARLYLTGLGLLIPAAGPSAGPDSVRTRMAAAALDSCVRVEPGFAVGVRALGGAQLLRFAQGHDARALAEARACSARLAGLAPGYADGASLRGDAARVAGEADSAVAAYGDALALDAGHYAAGFWRAYLLASQSRVAEAEFTYLQMAAAKPDYWQIYSGLGAFYYGQDRIDEAEAAWRRSLALAPRDALTLSNLGAVHHRRNEWSAARELFLEAFRIKPGCESCNNVATTLYFDGKYDEASRYFEFAIQYCDSNDASTWGNLASALYWSQGGRERSRQVYGKAIAKALAALERNPGDAMLTAFLIDYYVMSDDTLNTRATITRAGSLAEENARVMYSVGSAYEKMGQRDLALHHLANAVRHGFPLSVIEHAPVLRGIVQDSRFQEVIRGGAADQGAATASGKR
jgi:serine/threonine-protein kinase